MGDLVLITSSPKRHDGPRRPGRRRGSVVLRRADARRAALPLAGARLLGRGSRRRRRGGARAPGTPRQLVRGARAPSRTGQRRARAAASASGPEGTLHGRLPRPSRLDPPYSGSLRRRLSARRTMLPGGRLGTFRGGGGVAYGELQSTLDIAARCQELHASRCARALAGARAARARHAVSPPSQHDLDPQLASDLRRGGAHRTRVALVVLAVRARRSRPRSPSPSSSRPARSAATLRPPRRRRADRRRSRPYATNLVELIGLGLGDRLLAAHRVALPGGAAPGRSATMRSPGRWRPPAAPSSSRASPWRSASRCCSFVPVPFVRTLGLGGAARSRSSRWPAR